MSQIDRAAEVVAKVLDGVNSYTTEAEAASRVAQALADAGYLAPNLPEPDGPGMSWGRPPYNTCVTRHPEGGCMVRNPYMEWATPKEARQEAVALLAAAKWAEDRNE